LVMVWAIVPGTGASLVWPAEYLMLGAWLILGVIMWMLSKKKSRKESLGEMLGDEVYAHIAPFEDDAEQAHSATRNLDCNTHLKSYNMAKHYSKSIWPAILMSLRSAGCSLVQMRCIQDQGRSGDFVLLR